MKCKIQKDLNGTTGIKNTVSEMKTHEMGLTADLDTTREISVDMKTQKYQLSKMKHKEK